MSTHIHTHGHRQQTKQESTGSTARPELAFLCLLFAHKPEDETQEMRKKLQQEEEDGEEEEERERERVEEEKPSEKKRRQGK